MSNLCMYGMTVEGNINDIKKLASYMKGEQPYQLAGVQTDDTYFGNHDGTHVINGGCRNTVELSMLGTVFSYYHRAKDKSSITTLEQLTKKLDLKVEIIGSGEINEKFIINRGVIEYEIEAE